MRAGTTTRRKTVRRQSLGRTLGTRPETSGQERGHSYTATEAKNEFGHLLDEAARGATVVITRHDTPRAVLLSMDRYHALQNAPQLKLDTLRAEFDTLLAHLQGDNVRAGMQRAFSASPEELGKAAVDAARRRG